MKIQDYTKEMVDEKSFIDMAYTLLHDKGSTMNLYDIIDEFKSLGNYEYDEIENRIVQFYTDLNTDGRFLNVGENQWGLRDWYSVDDIEEKLHQQFKNLIFLMTMMKKMKILSYLATMKWMMTMIFQLKRMIETLDDSDDNEEDIDGSDIVIEEDDDDDIAEGEEEAFEDAEDFND